ncbi:hypothetical protein H5410_049097 [Solanum commersonii]|uniref:Uncharacterized protein n=1 Tax=Solanum commersonii TaxID=4109 RepID=A0A9J5XMG9_SOLCO|nr:hypothetical protein H5410_049097 [Solanum commersonii]
MGKEVFSVCASPHRLLVHIWAVLKAAVIISANNFNPIIIENDIGWYIFMIIPSICTGFGITLLIGDLRAYKILITIEFILIAVRTFIHHLVIHSISYWYREMPFRLIGAKTKFMIELIPILTLAALHHLFQFNYAYLHLVVGFTSYFYTIAHFMHEAYDIEGKDVLLGLAMQVLAYLLNGELLVKALALSLGVVLCFYRYVMYSAPEVPEHRKKELERLPC